MDVVQTNGRRSSNGSISGLSLRGSTSQLAVHEETHEEHEEHEENDQYDDETASKGSNESKESKKSFNERVIDTNYDSSLSTKNQMLRRKSVAPALHSTLSE